MRPATMPGARMRKTIVPIHARAGEAAWAMRVRLARFLRPREETWRFRQVKPSPGMQRQLLVRFRKAVCAAPLEKGTAAASVNS
jgi:hypothetical protein